MYTSIAIKKVKDFVDTHDFDPFHDFNHVVSVLSHVQKMVLYHPGPRLTPENAENLNLAALLHDVDNRKFFPESNGCQNARKILNEIFPEDWIRIEEIVYIIGLVSPSSNDNDLPVDNSDLWKLYPRFADRLEKIGPNGVKRYKLYNNRPLFVPETPRCVTSEELWKVATPERFKNYLKVGKSVSMIDHFYDNLLHIASPESLKIVNNLYLISEAELRRKHMVDYVLEFNRTGRCD